MCGRYVVTWQPDELSERFQLRRLPNLLEAFETYNAAPTQELPVIVTADSGERELRWMRWGLKARWAKPGDKSAPAPFNARAETLTEKPMFRSLVSRKRCLVPLNGYYEWREEGGRKQPYFLSAPDEELIALGGLFDEPRDDEGLDGPPLGSFTVVTTAPSEFAAQFHHRMPLVLTREAEEGWIDPERTDPGEVLALAQPFPGDLTARPVSRAVNNVRANDRHLIDPIDEEPADGDESDGEQLSLL